MNLPDADTPLYNHPLPQLEQWLSDLGCEQKRDDLHCWSVERASWSAELCLEVEELMVRYIKAGSDGTDIIRAFKYSLSREDVEAAVFSGP
ncbi:MAG: hypothetical protein N5P05_000031 [Chroococcopsis gigantea SAG 12.99]|jgi:hypothetical protein|nr:DUF3143 domain-containing protein [Chlorogloea purpurea SAG 13.99]MDV2998425.1 hypothetical protein [Chroococcopsis gigantea SAG 12.99]